MFEEILRLFNTEAWSLWGPFLTLLACGFGLPVPEDVVLVAAGFLGAQTGVHPVMTCILMYAGILIGDFMIFVVGTRFGPRILNSRLGRWIMGEDRQAKAQELFHKYGNSVILVARFLPGLRAPTYLTAGMLRYSTWKFLFYDGLAALLSAPVFVWLGHWAYGRYAENFDMIKSQVGRAKLVVIIVGLLIAAMAFLILRRRVRKQQSMMPPPPAKSTVD